MFSEEAKSKSSAISTATNWTTTFLVSKLILLAIDEHDHAIYSIRSQSSLPTFPSWSTTLVCTWSLHRCRSFVPYSLHWSYQRLRGRVQKIWRLTSCQKRMRQRCWRAKMFNINLYQYIIWYLLIRATIWTILIYWVHSAITLSFTLSNNVWPYFSWHNK